jgi:hypothetical protein
MKGILVDRRKGQNQRSQKLQNNANNCTNLQKHLQNNANNCTDLQKRICKTMQTIAQICKKCKMKMKGHFW